MKKRKKDSYGAGVLDGIGLAIKIIGMFVQERAIQNEKEIKTGQKKKKGK